MPEVGQQERNIHHQMADNTKGYTKQGACS